MKLSYMNSLQQHLKIHNWRCLSTTFHQRFPLYFRRQRKCSGGLGSKNGFLSLSPSTESTPPLSLLPLPVLGVPLFCRVQRIFLHTAASSQCQSSCPFCLQSIFEPGLRRMSVVSSATQAKRQLSLSPSKNKSSPVKKVKSEEEENTMPVVDESVKGGEGVGAVLKEIGNEAPQVPVSVGADDAKQEKLYFTKMSDKAFAPTRGSKVAAGYDLKSAYKCTVPARGSCLVKTDIQIQLPSGYYGRVAPRSGLALKNKIDVGAGVIDEDYRGNVGVILFNHGDQDFEVNEGDRVAQLICEKICYPDIVEVKEGLEETERGEGGFGSTGVGEQTKA